MERKRSGFLKSYNEIVFGKVSQSQVTKGEFHKTKRPKQEDRD